MKNPIVSVFNHATNDFYKPPHPEAPDTVLRAFPPTLARQEFADEADINVLMQRYERTGVMPVLPGYDPVYVDFTEMPSDLMGVMDRFHAAEASFMRLPAVVRREFDNDPRLFVDFAGDPANLDQMRAWGLAPPAEVVPPPPEPVVVRIVEAPPPGAPAKAV
jgi:Chlamydia-phage Chp2 scaffold (Chlamy_scaf)